MTKQSSRSVFSGTLENKLKKPRVQSRTNNETQSKSLFYYLVQTIKMIIKRAKIGIANTVKHEYLRSRPRASKCLSLSSSVIVTQL